MPLEARVLPVVEQGVKDVLDGVPADYLANHVACDFVETVRWWMANPGYTPEQVCGFFLATTHL